MPALPHNGVYVRSSKCGGASIKSALRRRATSSYTFNQRSYARYRLPSDGAERFLYTVMHGQVEPVRGWLGPVFDTAWKFAFVRNPWDRAISAYFYSRKCSQIPKDVLFKDYLRLEFSEMPEFVFVHSQPIADIICGPGGYRYLDFIGRFEHLQRDFDHVCGVLGLEATTLLHRHRTRHRPYMEYYDREGISLVRRKYRRDIEWFGYDFGA
jgi:Sulfotransferase family